MKPDELKLKIRRAADQVIDLCLPPQSNWVDGLKNATMKFWIELNIYRLDPILVAFVDKDGQIDITHFLSQCEQNLMVDGEFRLNIRDFIPQKYEAIKDLIPQKIILLRTSDFYNMFN